MKIYFIYSENKLKCLGLDNEFNLAAGSASSAKENLQMSTTGGAVSANIDATRQTNAAAHEAKQAETTGGGGKGDTVAGTTATPGDGGESSGTISSGAASGGAVAFGNDPGGIGAGMGESSRFSESGYGGNDGDSSFQKPEYRDKF